jgi:hypothetical protein
MIDAGGLGALVSLRAGGIRLKLMQPVAHVRSILSLTKLNLIFEICESESPDEMWKWTDPAPHSAAELANRELFLIECRSTDGTTYFDRSGVICLRPLCPSFRNCC